MSTGELEGLLGSPGLVIIDASSHLPAANRDAQAEFTQGHIPGARFLDLASLYDPASAVPSALPTAEQVASRLQALGIDPNSRLVIYDDSDVRTAARAWFIMRSHGIADVAILDGGLGKWQAENRPLEGGMGEAPTVAGTRRALSQTGSRRGEVRSKDQMLVNIERADEQVLDARDAGRFSGKTADFRPDVAPGHIPGSRNLPFTDVFRPDGTYKDPAELRRIFTDAGVDLERPIVTTCGGGVTAAVLLFALHLIGKGDVALYDGSWSEWGADPATPKELGSARIG